MTWSGSKPTRYRDEVYRRYGRICYLCGLSGADSVDHVIPVARGGEMYDIDNMRPAHIYCNKRKGVGISHSEIKVTSGYRRM